MYKLIVADDEPKIRRGLKTILDWNAYGVEFVGEAEDGESAYAIVKEKKPDIMFLDICMPFLNGIDLIKKLKEDDENCRVIIITGYDEFKYAQQAIKYGVFDYLLKPVTFANIEKAVQRAVLDLNKTRSEDNYLNWINEKSDEVIDIMREKFFSSLINSTAPTDLENDLNLIKIKSESNIGIIVIKIGKSPISDNLNKAVLCYGIRNIIIEMLGKKNFFSCFFAKHDSISIIFLTPVDKPVNICTFVTDYVEQYVESTVIYEQKTDLNLTELSKIYQQICTQINEKSKLRPITKSILNYIEHNYSDKRLSLESVSENFKMSPSYLSKIMKAEIGMPFVDYLTDTRIKKAKFLLENPITKIYEISELVGFSNQYYFSRTFKKVTGMSPIQFKEGKLKCGKEA